MILTHRRLVRFLSAELADQPGVDALATRLADALTQRWGGHAVPAFSASRPQRIVRDELIRLAIDNGASYRATARRFGLSPARIVQIAGAVQ